MRPMSVYLAAVGAAVLMVCQTGLALEPGVAGGVAGLSGPAHVTAGWGRASDDGLARPGFASRVHAGQIGVTPAGTKGGLNPGTDSDFHLSGMGRVINGGIGRSTMETVPGLTPTYINTVAGTRMAPYMASRGP
jgi:hypothetical protein